MITYNKPFPEAGHIFRLSWVNYYYVAGPPIDFNNFEYLPSLLRIGGVFKSGTSVSHLGIFFDKGIHLTSISNVNNIGV